MSQAKKPAMNERGSLLITAVWVVLFFSILTAALGARAGRQTLLMRRELNGFKERQDFASGLQEAAGFIGEDSSAHEDSKDKPWFGELKTRRLKEGLSIHLEDEESKLNLNHAPAAFLSAFFKEFEEEAGPLKGQRKEYVKAILKLRFERKIDSLEELLLLEDFAADDLEILRKYLTVYPERPLVNVNTASPLVLRALVESLSADHSSKLFLSNRLEEACRGGGCSFLSGDLAPEKFAEKLKLPKTPVLMQAVQALVTALTTDSETFRIVIKSEKSEVLGIFRCRAGQPRPEVFYWHEKV